MTLSLSSDTGVRDELCYSAVQHLVVVSRVFTVGGPQIIVVLIIVANNESMYFFLSSATTTKVY